MGGTPACHRLAVAFYGRVERDPLLRPLFPGKTLTCAIEEFSAFLVQFLGGPSGDTERRWWVSLHESHLRFKIGQKERDAWISNMVKALDDVQIGEPARAALLDFFKQSSAYVVNSPAGPLAADLPLTDEIAHRWKAQCKLDGAVAAVRERNAERAISLSETCDRSVLPGLLAIMIGSGQGAMLAYVYQRLNGDPALVHERYAGRTLLHGAAATGNLTVVNLLLRLGAGPDAKDGGGHTPLYCLANECAVSGAGSVAGALIEAGADVNASDGVKHCTALHMAARRGNIEVAQALIDLGAGIEARDSLGDTPLRRAVNCGRSGVASLLLSRGADVHAIGSKRLTPLLAARTLAMKQLLKS
jgi:truncated hemoglobin YjbI